jgi:membrane-associated phospholipid phosphatase
VKALGTLAIWLSIMLLGRLLLHLGWITDVTRASATSWFLCCVLFNRHPGLFDLAPVKRPASDDVAPVHKDASA